MENLSSLTAKSNLLHRKLAADNQAPISMLGREGYLGGVIAALGSAGYMLRSGYKAIAPSLLDTVTDIAKRSPDKIFDIMHSIRTIPSVRGHLSPEQMPKFITELQQYHKEVEKLKNIVNKGPKSLRHLLGGAEIPGISNHVRQDFRDIAFGDTFGSHIQTKFDPLYFERHNIPKTVNPGDVFVNFDTNTPKNLLTGGNYSHVGIATAPNKVHDLAIGSTKPGESFSQFGSHVKLRPVTGISSPLEATDALLHESMPYDYKLLGNVGMREIVPELNRSKSSFLEPLLNFFSRHHKKVKSILPKELTTKILEPRIGCLPGEICSTFAGRAAEKMLPGVLGKDIPQTSTPNSFMRSSRYVPESVNLAPNFRDPSFLRKQNLLKYGPLLVRAPLIAGAGLLGLYSLSKSLQSNPITSEKEPIMASTNIRQLMRQNVKS